MGLIREPKNVDFSTQSKPWTDEELRDFRTLMKALKAKSETKKRPTTTNKKKTLAQFHQQKSPNTTTSAAAANSKALVFNSKSTWNVEHFSIAGEWSSF